MISINLANPSVVTRRRIRRRVRQWTLTLTVAVALLSIPVWLEYSRQYQVRTLNSELTVNRQLVNAAQEQIKQLDIEVNTVRAQLARANALRAKRSWHGLITRIASATPDAVWMTSLATIPAVAPSGNRSISPNSTRDKKNKDAEQSATIVTLDAPREMVIEGYSTGQPAIYDFVSELSSSQVFADVRLTRASEERLSDGKAIMFHVRCAW